jgi:hypothetical protein
MSGARGSGAELVERDGLGLGAGVFGGAGCGEAGAAVADRPDGLLDEAGAGAVGRCAEADPPLAVAPVEGPDSQLTAPIVATSTTARTALRPMINGPFPRRGGGAPE